jgi:hypothetical protein
VAVAAAQFGLTAYDPSAWSDLFVATAGASAALAGLVFVAVSINIERILQFAGLPQRALQTVLLLLSVVLVSIIGLIPGQGNTALGAELLGEGLLFGVVLVVLAKRSLGQVSESRAWLLPRHALLAVGTLPLIVDAFGSKSRSRSQGRRPRSGMRSRTTGLTSSGVRGFARWRRPRGAARAGVAGRVVRADEPGTGAVFTHTIELQPKGAMRLLGPLLGPIVRSGLRKDLQRRRTLRDRGR